MSTHQRNRGASRTQSSSSRLSGGAFAAGLVVGSVLTLALIALLERKPALPAFTITGSESTSAEASDEPLPTFEFYTLLNELEVSVPESAIASAQQNESTIYWLQAASFRNQQDAEQARASLLLLNLNASLSQVSSQGSVWYRIMVGPFDSRTQMASARQRLIEQNYQPLLMTE